MTGTRKAAVNEDDSGVRKSAKTEASRAAQVRPCLDQLHFVDDQLVPSVVAAS